jgi:hypothetical protein
MLNNPIPIVTEPIPAKIFDKLHPYSLHVIQESNGYGSIYLELIPCNASGEFAGISQKITCPLTSGILQAVPELQTAFDAVIAAIQPTKLWLDSQNNIN